MDDENALVWQARCSLCGWESALVTLAQAKAEAEIHVVFVHDGCVVWPDDAAGEEDAT